jgi:hypothetical protein
MVFRIPLLADYLELWTPVYGFYDHLIPALCIASIGILAFVSMRSISYGKGYTRGTSLFKVELPDRLCVITVNLPCLIVFGYAQLYFPNGEVTSIPSLLYIGHYIHRALIYPWFRRTQSKPWPLEHFLFYLVVKFFETTIVARTLIFDRLP